ncbi:MAG: tripartite tricarboxylate transporter TctB family protein [Pseudomonadota bacterium]
MKNYLGTIDRISALCMIVFVLFVLWESRGLPLGTLQRPGAGFVPVLIASFLGSISILMLILGGNSPPLRSLEWPEAKSATAVIATCGFVALTLEIIGYRITMAVALIFLLGVIERKKWVGSISIAIIFSLMSYWIFNVLGVYLPRGPLGF